MNSNTQAIFFDVDGTSYLHRTHSVPTSTLFALRKLKEKGIKLAICTSRVKGEMIHLPQEFLDLFDGIIVCGGALIEVNHQVLECHSIDKDDAQRILSYCRENGIVARWADDGMNCCFDQAMDEKITDIFRYLYLMEPTLKPYTNENLIHLLFYPQMNSQKVNEEVNKLLKNSNLVCLQRCMEATSFNISKASALKTLSQFWQIPISQTMAFGDGFNDIEMLKTAGVGVAMGQANEKVKEAANYITSSIEEDGIFLALQHFGILD